MTEQKEHTAIESLYRTKYRTLLRAASVLVHDKETASDIVGEAFLSLVEHHKNIPPDKYFSYVYSAIHFRAVNFRKATDYRREVIERIKERESRMFGHYTASIEAAGFNSIYSNEILEICRERLSKCSPKAKEIFMMSRMSGISRREISNKLEMSENQVKYELEKITKDLSMALKDYRNCLPVIIPIILSTFFKAYS